MQGWTSVHADRLIPLPVKVTPEDMQGIRQSARESQLFGQTVSRRGEKGDTCSDSLVFPHLSAMPAGQAVAEVLE